MERQEKHHKSKEEEEIIAYLLGALTEIESDHFEQRYLEDPALFAEMQEVEDELIDDYANGALMPEDRFRFEQHFLRTPDRREKVRFAVAMRGRAASWKKEKRTTGPSATVVIESSAAVSNQADATRDNLLQFRRWLRPIPAWREWGAIAAAILIAIAAGALWLRNREAERELTAAHATELRLHEEARLQSTRAQEGQTQLESERLRANTLQMQLQTVSDQVKTLAEQTRGVGRVVVKAFVGLEYLARNTRGGSEGKVKTLNVPVNAGAVRLGVEFEETAFQNFRATLLSVDGNPTWSSLKILKARTTGGRQSLMLTIPSASLGSAEHQLIINAVKPQGEIEVARYRLRIVRR
jgi:hypothetical protein